MTPLARFAGHVFDVLVAVAPWLLLGVVIAGALSVLLPPGRSRAIMAGAPESGPSAFPHARVDAWLLTGGHIGWPFALTTVVVAGVLSLLHPILIPRRAPAPEQPNPDSPPQERSIGSAARHSLALLDSMSGWLVLAILMSAAITTWAPHKLIGSLGEIGTVLAYVVAIGLAVLPWSGSATASVPIAGALLGAGFPPGAALVFLLVGPATNARQIGAIHRTAGGRVLAVYLGMFVVGTLALALGLDPVLKASAPSCCAPEAEHVNTDAPGWQVLSGAVLLGRMIWNSTKQIRRKFTAGG